MCSRVNQKKCTVLRLETLALIKVLNRRDFYAEEFDNFRVSLFWHPEITTYVRVTSSGCTMAIKGLVECSSGPKEWFCTKDVRAVDCSCYFTIFEGVKDIVAKMDVATNLGGPYKITFFYQATVFVLLWPTAALRFSVQCKHVVHYSVDTNKKRLRNIQAQVYPFLLKKFEAHIPEFRFKIYRVLRHMVMLNTLEMTNVNGNFE
jgi:hypothetical protein